MSREICRTAIAALVVVTGCATAATGALEGGRLRPDSTRAAPLGATAASAQLVVAGTQARGAASIVELLNGRVGGLRAERRANGGVSLRMRGMGSALWAEPLVLVDGIALPDGPALGDFLAMISPEDVVRVDVLRDPSATAIYGPRGAEGVVLITCRQPRR